MTTIRITGNPEEVRRIFEGIKDHIPTVLEVNEYDQREGSDISIYIVCMEQLQKDAKGNLQDWAIIEYCRQWRTTPEIKKYFSMSYEETREICDRLYACGALGRRLIDKSYGYIDRGLLHRCSDCMHYQELT